MGSDQHWHREPAASTRGVLLSLCDAELKEVKCRPNLI